MDNAGAVVLVNPEPGGKTSLALQFAHAARDHFRSVLWTACAGSSPEFIAGGLARQLGARVEAFGREAFAHLGEIARRHRILIVLDELDDPAVLAAAPQGSCSALATARSVSPGLPPHASVLPIGSLPPPPPAPLPAPGSSEHRLLHAMATCRPAAVPLALAGAIFGLPPQDAAAAAQSLLAAGWADPLDAAGSFLRLPAHASRALPGAAPLRRKHAEALLALFRANGPRAECAAEIEHALHWASQAAWDLAVPLASLAFRFFLDHSRPCEAALLFRRLRDAAHTRGDAEVASRCDSELFWIEDSRGEIKFAAPPRDQLAFDFS